MNLRKTGILLAWAMIIAANGTAQNVQRTSQGIKYAAQGMNVSVEFYSPSIVRVYKTPGETASDKESLVVIKAPEQTPVSFGENGKNVTLSSQMIQVEVNPETGGIHFFDKLGQRLLTDKDYGTQFTPFNDAGVPSYNVRQAFLLDKDEVIYEGDQPSSINYLGFLFDGKSIRIRPHAITKYYYRMRRKAHTIGRSNWTSSKGRRISAKELYSIYSRNDEKQTFIDYARKAKGILKLNDQEANALIKHHKRKIAMAIKEGQKK